MIKIACAWCGKLMGYKPMPPGTLWYGPKVSHGICRTCYLERFDQKEFPVTPDMDLEWKTLADSLKGQSNV
jgi:hypothetical protein